MMNKPKCIKCKWESICLTKDKNYLDCRGFEEQTNMTGRDKINAMSNEELADTWCNDLCPKMVGLEDMFFNDDCKRENCKQCWLNTLESEVKNG